MTALVDGLVVRCASSSRRVRLYHPDGTESSAADPGVPGASLGACHHDRSAH
jgi:hypothetical protein